MLASSRTARERKVAKADVSQPKNSQNLQISPIPNIPRHFYSFMRPKLLQDGALIVPRMEVGILAAMSAALSAVRTLAALTLDADISRTTALRRGLGTLW